VIIKHLKYYTMLLQKFLSTKSVTNPLVSFGLLVVRVAICAMMLTHGINKLSNFSEMSQHFDPIGIGGSLSLSLVIFAELFCSIAVMIGLFTRLCVVPLIFAMCVAAFIYFAGQDFASRELALLYLTFYTGILIIGPGRYSIDKLIWK